MPNPFSIEGTLFLLQIWGIALVFVGIIHYLKITKFLRVKSFTFGAYKLDKKRSTLTCTYTVRLRFGLRKTFTDKLVFKDISGDMWDKIPESVLEPTLQALLIMLGVNYWCVFPTKDMRIEKFSLTREQAKFWDSLYLNGLGEFFYVTKTDFRDLIAFPYDEGLTSPPATPFPRPEKSLVLNGAGKDSILSAEILKTSGSSFDFFSFSPTPAHERIADLVGAKNICVHRRYDPMIVRSGCYPSVSTFTFIAVLLAEVLGYDKIIFSNERSADIGNLTYLGLSVNHQWCKSSEAEKMINEYIQKYITPDIKTTSLLRKYSELDIVKRFVEHPQYLQYFTSCNTYFWLPRAQQLMQKKSYWCTKCPKCIFLFACFAAFLPKQEMIQIFGADLYNRTDLLPYIKRILGIEGFKPLDCVGEPEEMIMAMRYASLRGEYAGEPAMELFEKHFPADYDFETLKKKVHAVT